MTHDLKSVADIGAISTLIATVTDALPHVAALLTVIWMAFRIYELRTVQRWLRGGRTRKEDFDANNDL